MQEFNPIQTEKIDSKPQYQRYKKWLIQNGVLFDPRIRYPSVFGNNGLVGVSASKIIQKNRAIVAIPYNLIITADKIKNMDPFGDIIRENPDVFRMEQDYAFMILVLYLSVEFLKGQKSFYFPYFQIALGPTVWDWTHWDMMAMENRQITTQFKQQKDQLQLHFLTFLRIYRRYEKVFPPQISNAQYKDIFNKAQGIICTRAFGWSLPSISLIPLADSFNHGHTYVDHYLVDINLQKSQQCPQSYIRYKQKANLTILNDAQLNPSKQQLDKLRKPKLSKRYRFVQKHKQILQGQNISDKSQIVKKQHLKILYQQYKAQIHNIRQLHFYQSSCSQDNDTDQQTLHNQTYKQQKFYLSEKYGQKKSKINKIKQYWKIYQDTNLQKQSSQQELQQQIIIEKQNKQKNVDKQSQGSTSLVTTSSQQQDQKFDWINNTNLDKVYFIMQTKQIIKQNQQIYNFYGRRSNKFLLLGYNFVMLNNCYDSYTFRFKIDLTNKSLNAQKLIYLGKLSKKLKYTRQIRLKPNRVNIKLINHCRCLISQQQKQQTQNIKLTIPYNIQIQISTLLLAKDILKYLFKCYITSIEDDQQLLEKSNIKHEANMAIRLRLNHKKILLAQQQLISKCLQFLKRWKNGRLNIQQSQMQQIKKTKAYLSQLQRSKL